MAQDTEFEKILELFEENGWVLQKIWPPYRVFAKDGELPWLVPVYNNEVDYEYIEKIKAYFEQKDSPEGQ